MAEFYDVDRITNDQTGDVFHLKDYSLDKAVSSPAPIVSFPDGAPYPMSLTAAIDPVQDLHGYANPWPGGGNKNMAILDLAKIKELNTSGTWNGNDYTWRGIKFTVNTDSAGNVTSFTLNGTATNSWLQLFLWSAGDIEFPAGSYVMSTGEYMPSNVFFTSISTVSNRSSLDVTISETKTSQGYIGVGELGIQITNLKVYPMICLATASEPTTFAPYSNICPITGFDGANVTVTGKNLYDDSLYATYKQSDGTYVGTLAQLNNLSGVSPTFKWMKKCIGQTFTFSFEVVSNPNGRSIRATYKDNGISHDGTSTTSTGRVSVTFTVTSTFEFAYIRFASGSTDTVTLKNIQIEAGRTLTDFEPFGKVYPITFPTSAGTVYGGTVTVNPDGTGELVVDRKCVTLTGDSSEGWNRYGSSSNQYRYRTDCLTDRKTGFGVNGTQKTNYLKTTTGDTDAGSSSIVKTGNSITFLYDSSRIYVQVAATGIENDISAWETYLSNNSLQVSYLLAEPVTYSLTPGQVLSLLGQNNVWADTGDIQSLSYVRNTVPEMIRQDTAGQIASALDPVESSLAIVIDGDVAVGGLDSGKYVFLRSHSTLARGLYHTTEAIAAGASITENNTEPDDEGGLNSLFESGTWTPVIQNMTISEVEGSYIRIGAICVCSCKFKVTAVGQDLPYVTPSSLPTYSSSTASIIRNSIEGTWSSSAVSNGTLGNYNNNSIWFAKNGTRYNMSEEVGSVVRMNLIVFP